MEALLILLVLGLVIGVPVWLIVRTGTALNRARDAESRAAEIGYRLTALEHQLEQLRAASQPAPHAPPSEQASPVPAAPLATTLLEARRAPQPPPPFPTTPAPVVVAPPLIEPQQPLATVTAEAAASTTASIQPAAAAPQFRIPLPSAPPPRKPAIDWEQFMGVKMFAWLGGLALFLAVGFFIKYSFEQGWVSPPIRVVMGCITGLGLIIGGLRLNRERYAVTIQTLCGAGVLILYGDIFGACSLYHLIPNPVGFALMVLVTAAAFLMAVRLDAQAIAVLGLLGGFLTPPLMSTGVDRPVGLFSYLALLDIGLLAVALRKRWNHLTPLAAAGTVIMQFGWVAKFFAVEKIGIAMTVFLGFAWLFAAAFAWANRAGHAEKFLSAAALVMPASALMFALYLIGYPYRDLATRPGLLFGYVFAADAALLALAWLRAELRIAQVAGGGAVFLLLAVWTGGFLTTELLNWGLACYFVFAVVHSIYPVVLARYQPAATSGWWLHLFAPAALLLVLVSMFKLTELSLAIWPVVLLIDLLAIILAALTASLLAIVVVLLLTVGATAVWVLRIPAELTGVPGTLWIIAGFAAFFFGVSIFLMRKLAPRLAEIVDSTPSPFGFQLRPNDVAHIPALSAILPFLLLTMVVMRLPLVSPSPVFGLAALMIVLLLALVRVYALDLVAPIALACLAVLEGTWQFHRFAPDNAAVTLGWQLGFYALLTAFPFVFQRHLAGRTLPWAIAALAGPVQFFFVYKTVKVAYANSYMGLLPAAFVLPSLLALVRLLKSLPAEGPKRNTPLALFGGVTLFFITLIFPIQFERQWITVGWALEGAALLWLLHRIPHEGLKITGVALLIAAFVRLVFNPAVFHYYSRSETLIFNWWLFAYGVASAACFAGGWLLAPPRNRIRQWNLPPWLFAMGTVLAFWLVNIEIADAFSQGTTVRFEFSGNFARDMTYSIAWAVFAFIVLTVGIRRKLPAARYAGIGLLVVTILKLFLHDLWSLGGLYRIGSLIGLALVLIPVSFLYQKFLSPKDAASETSEDTAP